MGTWGTVFSLAKQHGPKLYRELQKSGAIDKGKAALQQRLGSGATAGDGAGRPITDTFHDTGSRARSIEYSPQLDGQADPGEIVWTWVEFEEHNGEGKDRPVLVVGRDGKHLLGLMLSSQQHRRDDADWESIGSGSWDNERRESFIRLDRVLDVPEAGIRREGAILSRDRFDRIANRLRAEYNWS
jgi:hypothetical protein